MIKKEMLIFMLLFSLIMFFGCSDDLENNENKKKEEEKPIEIHPTEKTIIENIIEIKDKLKNTNKYYVSSIGEVNTKALVIDYKQDIKSDVFYQDGLLYKESISYSTLKKVALKQIFVDYKCYSLKGKEIKAIDDVSWQTDYEEETMETYLNTFGTNPYDFLAYIINEDTIIDSSLATIKDINNESLEKFKLTLKLDPVKSVVNYQKEMKEMSNASEYPQFEEIIITIYFDKQWLCKQVLINEKYTIKIPIIGKFNCTSTLTQIYYYNDACQFTYEDFRNK